LPRESSGGHGRREGGKGGREGREGGWAFICLGGWEGGKEGREGSCDVFVFFSRSDFFLVLLHVSHIGTLVPKEEGEEAREGDGGREEEGEKEEKGVLCRWMIR